MLDDVAKAWRLHPSLPVGPIEQPPASGAIAKMEQRLASIQLSEVDFNGAGLSAVLTTLSALASEREAGGSGLNLVLLDPAGADPHVCISLRNLPLRRVLDLVTASVGYCYEVQPDAVVFRPGGERTVLETAVLPLSPAIAARMAEAGSGGVRKDVRGADTIAGSATTETTALRRFLEQAGVRFDSVDGSSVVFDGSALLVTQSPRNMERIRMILSRYSSVRQVEIEAKFLEVEAGALEELGISWSASRRPNSVTGFPQEVYRADNRSLAGAFAAGTSGSSIQIDGAAVANVVPPVLPGTVPLAAGAKPLAEISGYIGEFDVGATLRALSQKQGSDLLSAPRVTVLSGHPARITVARQLRYPQQFGQIQSQVGQSAGQNSGSAGVTITAGTPQDFTTQNVGVELSVTPTVEEDARSITLELQPVVTEFEGFVEYGGPSLAVSGGKTVTIPSGFYQPIFSRRSVTTRVTLWDGATLVMGGLTREETRKVNDKVPLLGDLPAVGRLFRSTGEGATKRNLLIFVTARLVGPAGGLRLSLQEQVDKPAGETGPAPSPPAPAKTRR
jgi:general secretion pathway protein D